MHTNLSWDEVSIRISHVDLKIRPDHGYQLEPFSHKVKYDPSHYKSLNEPSQRRQSHKEPVELARTSLVITSEFL